eukprot:1146729-Pelagomonas_calceolata.AAC.1
MEGHLADMMNRDAQHTEPQAVIQAWGGHLVLFHKGKAQAERGWVQSKLGSFTSYVVFLPFSIFFSQLTTGLDAAVVAVA